MLIHVHDDRVGSRVYDKDCPYLRILGATPAERRRKLEDFIRSCAEDGWRPDVDLFAEAREVVVLLDEVLEYGKSLGFKRIA